MVRLFCWPAVPAAVPRQRRYPAVDCVRPGDSLRPRPRPAAGHQRQGRRVRVSIATLDDMRVLYDGFDLCAPDISVSMTINGRAGHPGDVPQHRHRRGPPRPGHEHRRFRARPLLLLLRPGRRVLGHRPGRPAHLGGGDAGEVRRLAPRAAAEVPHADVRAVAARAGDRLQRHPHHAAGAVRHLRQLQQPAHQRLRRGGDHPEHALGAARSPSR
jgi:hypothetical protein